MKIFSKIAVLITSLAIISTMAAGCRNVKKITEDFAVVKLGCENAAALDNGEILVYETFKTEKNIEERLYSTVTETYIKFITDGTLQYDFTQSVKNVETGIVDLLEVTLGSDGLIAALNGVVTEVESPDIFKYFDIDYDVADIESILVADTGNGTTLYAFTMTEKYTDKFDSSDDELEIDCTKVVYNYYIDTAGVARNILSEFTSTVKYDGNTQTVVRFIQTTIN